MLIHEICTTWAMAWVHVFVSKWFLSLVTPSVTAWVLLVYICEQDSFQVGHSNLCCCEPAVVMARC